ncbi:MAG: potassium channel family protein [Acidobacteriota bacterium]
MQWRYFSFMTLTIVGYGDIVPHSPAARTLATLEAITGQIYLTALMARLVGLHIVHASSSASRKD